MAALGTAWSSQAGFVEQAAEPATLEVNVTPGTGTLDLSWEAVDSALKYLVFCGLSPDQLLPVGETYGISFSIDSLRGGMQYFVQVVACFAPQRSIASVSDDGSGIMVATQLLPFGTLSCTPLSADVCYQLIQASTEPLVDNSANPGGPGSQPYSFDYESSWSDDSNCGWNVQVFPRFTIIATISHINIPPNVRKQRRIVFTMMNDDQQSIVVLSSPAAGGDPMPSGTFPRDTVITIDFTSDCSGNLTAAVEVVVPT